MKNYISQVCKIIDLLEVKNNKDEALQKLQELKSEMIFEQASLNMSKSEKSFEKAIKEILDGNDKNHDKFKKLFKNEDKVCFCNGFLGGFIEKEPKGLEISDEKVLDMLHIIPNKYYEDYQEVSFDMEQVEVLFEENKHIKNPQDKQPYVFASGDIQIGLNPKYIKQMLAIYGKDAKFYARQTSSRAPVIIESEIGTGIILPIMLEKGE